MPKHRGQKTRTGKTVKPNSMGEQGSISLRRSCRVCAPSRTALHFWLTASKTSYPPYRRTCLGAVNMITGYGTLPSCCTVPSPLDPSILLYSTLNHSAVQSFFSLSTHLYNTPRALSLFFLVASLPPGFTAALSRSSAKCSICPPR